MHTWATQLITAVRDPLRIDLLHTRCIESPLNGIIGIFTILDIHNSTWSSTQIKGLGFVGDMWGLNEKHS